MLPRIKEIISVEPFKITCLWNTGEMRLIDFQQFLPKLHLQSSQVTSLLLNKNTFSTVKLDPEAQTLVWEGLLTMQDYDGQIKPAPLDFCPDVLYENSELVKNAA